MLQHSCPLQFRRPLLEKVIVTPYRPEFFSGLIFTTAQVVFITAKVAFMFTPGFTLCVEDYRIQYHLRRQLLVLMSKSNKIERLTEESTPICRFNITRQVRDKAHRVLAKKHPKMTQMLTI